MISIKERIDSLRSLMKSQGIRAYIVTSSDPHQNEYLPDFWQRRRFISGFTGSAGDAVVTLDKAGLWTDSRYFIQAQEELDSRIFTLFKMGLPEVPDIPSWLGRELKSGDSVGIDPRVITQADYNNLGKSLINNGIILKSIQANLIDSIWTDRPAAPSGSIQIHSKKYAGESTAIKLKHLRLGMEKEGAEVLFINKLDAIAWLFNIRGTDVRFNPVVIAYAVVESDDAALYIDTKKITPEAEEALSGTVKIRPYAAFDSALKKIGRGDRKVWLDEGAASRWMFETLGGRNFINKPGPVDMLKAVKNPVEIAGMRKAHIRDGQAMVKFLCWLRNSVGRKPVSEISAADKLEEFRRENPMFAGLSFETISAYGPHAAIIHYAPKPESEAELAAKGLYLIDSGGHYPDGTTDITRTLALGPPSPEQQDRFTRVLKGLIGLSRTAFPKGTVGRQLDTIARLPLWEKGLNYGHGTGHGIGHFLSVHEGPQAISYYRCKGTALEPGMVTSIEPGFYKEGGYGIRLENAAVVVTDKERSSSESDFYTFSTLTMCPIDRTLIRKELLHAGEIEWLDRYHRNVEEALSPGLDSSVRAWLKEECRPL